MKKKSHKKGSFLVTMGLLLIAAAFALIIYNLWTDETAGDSAEKIVEALNSDSKTGIEAVRTVGSHAVTEPSDEAGEWAFLPFNGDAETISEQNGRWLFLPMDRLISADVSENGGWVFVPFGSAEGMMEMSDETGRWVFLPIEVIENTQQYELPIYETEVQTAEYPDYLLNPDMEMPAEKIDGNKYIGVLQIPSMKLKLPVMGDWSYPKLKIAPCRYTGSAYQNNMIVCGHNYDRHFGRLKTLKIGAEIDFTDVEGNVFRYRVVELEILKPRAVQQMQSGDWDLTLFTCTIGGATRVTVRCERI